MESLMDQALEVELGSEESEIDAGAPTSGLEYLRRVRKEARKCEQVVVANINLENFKNRQTVRVSDASDLEETPHGFAASLEWQRYQTAFFSKVREKLTRHQARCRKEDPNCRPTLPKPTEEELWCKFCFGDEFNNLRRGRNLDTTTLPQGSENVNAGIPPLLGIIAALDQVTVCQLLEYHIRWFGSLGFSTRQGRWLYALLLCLEKPVLADSIAWLRALARHCASIRAKLVPGRDEERLTELNLLICLVARYFDQTDLADRPSQQT